VSAVRADEQEAQLAHVTDEVFRSVFRDHASRVVVVTAEGGRGPAGFTATSLPSVSLDPPMVSFAVARSASAWPTVERSRRLGVHLLADDQDGLATTFATSGINRFADVRWHPGPAGEPVIEDCAAFLQCTVDRHVPAGDHVLVLARVTRAHVARVGSPLIYHDGGYATVGPAPVDPVQTSPLRRSPR
jgi:flavin reductase (DIM6/NTAB) family NADH-FMN oxidoreductase RutF